MPSVSRQQQKAMHAAASGNSTLGIPESVGQDFAQADHARGPTKLPQRAGEQSEPRTRISPRKGAKDPAHQRAMVQAMKEM